MRGLFLILCVSVVVSREVAMAQLTPSIYRSEVVAYSWDLKSAESVVAQAEDKILYEKTARLPELAASGRYIYAFRSYDGRKDWTLNVEPQIIQTLYGGGIVRATIEQAEVAGEVARLTAEYTLLEVNYAADYAYWNLWAMNRHYQAMNQYVEIIKEESQVIERRFDEGYIPKGDLLMIAARLSEAEYNLTTADKSRSVALHNLNILRGVNPSELAILADISLDSMSVPIRVPIERVVNDRPDYIASKLSEVSAAAATRATRGAYNPQLYGGVGGSWRSYTPNYTGKTYLDGSVFVELSVPIFHFGERRKAVAISKETERQSQITTSMLYDTITQEESNAWAAVVESRTHLSVATRSLRIASENLEISTYSYNEGEVSIVELLQAQISWIQIYTNAIESEYNYQLALAYYARTVGRY